MLLHTQLLTVSSIAWFCCAAGFATHLGAGWNKVLEKRLGHRVDRYRALRMDESQLRKAFAIWGVALAALICGLTAHDAYPLAIVLGFLLYKAPTHVLDYVITRRERLLEEQLVGVAGAIGNGVKAGLSIPQSFENALGELPDPIRQDMSRIVYHYKHGRVLVEALADTRRRLQLEAFSLFSLAIEVAVERGGRLNQALHRIGISLREWQRLRRKVLADTAAGRRSVLILSVFPFAFLAFFLLFETERVLAMWTTLPGQIVMSVAIMIIYIGVKLARRVMTIKLS